MDNGDNWWQRFKEKMQQKKQERQLNRAFNKAERQMNRNDKKAQRIANKANGSQNQIAFGTAGEMGMTALTEAPKVVAATQFDPTDPNNMIDSFEDARKKLKNETNQSVLQMASSGLQVGSAAGPYGAAAGLIIGTGAGLWNKYDKMDGFNDKWDEKVAQEWNDEEKRLMETWYNDNDLQQMENTYKMLQQREY